MAVFLDQDAIDRLEYELSIVSARNDLAKKARDKLKIMYLDVTKQHLDGPLLTLLEIRNVITVLSSVIQSDNRYYQSFMLLKKTYIKRGCAPEL